VSFDQRGNPERRKLTYLLTTLAVVAMVTVAIVIVILYHAAIERVQQDLSFAARAQAELIEAVARHDASHRVPADKAVSGMSLVVDAFRRSKGFGETGEFVLARREGNDMVLVAVQRPHLKHPPRILFDAIGKGEPLRRALLGQTGTIIARDYRGETVLAAHVPIPELGLGLVAKIDRAEIRAPFVDAATAAAVVAAIAILFGAALFLGATDPFVRRLRESEARVRAVFDAVTDAIITVDERGVIESVNAGAQRLFGYAPQEIVGRNISRLMPESCCSVHDGQLRRLDSNEPDSTCTGCAAHGQRRDGSEFPAEIAISEMHLDGRRKFVGVVRDITRQHEAESRLRETAANLTRAEAMAHLGCWSFDAASGQAFWSDELYRILGCEPRSCTPGQELFLSLVHPDDRAQVAEVIAEAQRGGGPFTHSYRVVRPDGAERTLYEYGQATQTGESVRFFGVTQDVTEQAQAAQALARSEDRFARIFHSSPAIITISRLADGVFVDVNETFERASGWRRDEVIGRSALELGFWTGGAAEREALLARLRSHGSLTHQEWDFRGRHGEIHHLFGAIERIELNGEDCVLFVSQDVTERRREETERRKLSAAVEQAAEAVVITNRDGVIEYVNPAFETMTGYTAVEALGQTTRLLKSGMQSPEFYRELWQQVLAGEVFSEVFINKRKDGGVYFEEKTIAPLKDASGAITHFVATGRDITERMQTQERLQFMAHHDLLTELPNRALFLDRLKQSLARARWHRRLVAVLFLDLDRFKTINDSLGHDAGDQLLRAFAARLARCVREGDTVARFGGDEFVVLLNDIAATTDVATLAQKILEALAPPFELAGRVLHVTGSIGISLFPMDGEDSATLLKNADAAMYRAKESGKNTYQFYSSEMSARAFERLTLENSLRNALKRGEFELHYQPQVQAASGRLIGAEALLRWRHPDFGLVSPADFVPLLEETGMIVPVGEWVVRSACEQLAEWRRAGHAELRVAVNLSARQLAAPGLFGVISDALASHRLPAASLELEITESALLEEKRSTLDLLTALRELGVRLALDDFGTGYSSLSHLRRYPIDTLKIDRSFVQDLPTDANDVALTIAIIALGRSLNLELIAEGVESELQREFLLARDCQLMQGYLFSRPVPAAEFILQLATLAPTSS
jgi:diguanylate cyclase (GGDEF)-like protein/PAS domain S-box-containing protein